MGKIEIRLEAVIINSENKLLLALHLKNGKSYWVLPGGHLKFGEKLEDGLKRELSEELGLTSVRINELLFLDEFIDSEDKRHIVKAGFQTEIPSIKKEELIVTTEQESIKAARFFSSQEITDSKDMFYPSREFFINLLENRNG